MLLKQEQNQSTGSPENQSSNILIQYQIPLTGLKQSTNKIYAGVHWTTRNKFKDECCRVAKWFCRPVQKVESYPVEIVYKFFFNSRALDTLNCSYMAKCFEDAFRSFEILKDDSPKFVAKSSIEVIEISKTSSTKMVHEQSEKINKQKEDWVEIIIKKYSRSN